MEKLVALIKRLLFKKNWENLLFVEGWQAAESESRFRSLFRGAVVGVVFSVLFFLLLWLLGICSVDGFFYNFKEGRNTLANSVLLLVLSLPTLIILWRFRTHDTREQINLSLFSKGADLLSGDTYMKKAGLLLLGKLRNVQKVFVEEIDILTEGVDLFIPKGTGTSTVEGVDKPTAEGGDKPKAYGQGVSMKDADIQRMNLSMANLKRANLERANLEGANLEGANLEGTNLVGANLEGANFRFCHVTEDTIITREQLEFFSPEQQEILLRGIEKREKAKRGG